MSGHCLVEDDDRRRGRLTPRHVGGHSVAGVVVDELEDHMSPDYAEETLRTAIMWGRYAELYAYDEEAAQFSLEDIEDAKPAE